MSASENSMVIVDGLVVSRWSRSLFEDMRRGGLTAVNCSCSVWEDFRGSMARLADYKKMMEENGDIVTQIYTTQDIGRVRRENKVGILLGWQNTSGIDDQMSFLGLFHELGVRVMQLTYNTQNLVGSGCYEARDGGLSDFGRDVIGEMNRLGIVIDLSHVGARTADEAIRLSRQPVCYSHIAPKALKDHPRCKTDDQIRFIIDKGGFVGATPFPPFMPRGAESTVEDFLDMLEYMIGITGEDRLGIGTDFSQGDPYTPDYWVRDKGYGRKLTEFGQIKYPDGFQTSAEYPNLITSMQRRGWRERRIRNVMGENWVRFLRDVWGA